uniref:Uncharacterized protein n=1 Tax=Cacopsylla melanoneura TaxID=428564 RepID=A0A8D8ZRK7_9HEMI
MLHAHFPNPSHVKIAQNRFPNPNPCENCSIPESSEFPQISCHLPISQGILVHLHGTYHIIMPTWYNILVVPTLSHDAQSISIVKLSSFENNSYFGWREFHYCRKIFKFLQ